MKVLKGKRTIAGISALVMGITLIAGSTITVNAGSLADSVREMGKNVWYRNLIAEQSGFNNHSDFKFDVVDVDADGVEDLIMTYTRTDNDTTGAWVWSYNQYINGGGGFAGEVNTIKYCAETQYLQCIAEQTYGYTVSFGQLSGSQNAYVSYDIDFDGNYVTVDETTGEVTVIIDEEIIEKYELWEEDYMPNPVEACGKYETTEENLDTYLPLKIEAKTETLTLKVGEAFGLSTENIDKLLAEAGYDYASARPNIFHGNKVVIDAEYMERASGVGVWDVDAETTIEMLYVAEDEVQELFEQYQSGALNEKYGKEVILVDEAEGFAYYARAEKCGTTTITIKEYPITGDESITVNIPVSIEAELFTDVKEDDWYYEYARFALENGLMAGKGNLEDGKVKFAPADNITRAEFVQMLYSKEEKPAVEYKPTFTDVPAETWYTDAILWANENGIVSGKKENWFDVSGKITRQEIALILYNYANYNQYETTREAALNDFVDSASVSNWAQTGMKWAVGYQVIGGKPVEGGNALAPNGNAIRAEAATMMKAFMVAYEGVTE